MSLNCKDIFKLKWQNWFHGDMKNNFQVFKFEEGFKFRRVNFKGLEFSVKKLKHFIIEILC